MALKLCHMGAGLSTCAVLSPDGQCVMLAYGPADMSEVKIGSLLISKCSWSGTMHACMREDAQA